MRSYTKFNVLFLALFFVFFSLFGTAYAGAWGSAGFGVYVLDSRIVAPNGLTYDPLSRLQVDLNIGAKKIYLFSKSSFFTEKPTPGVTTNSNQGNMDFTKREFDLELGLAGRPFRNENIELRAWSISLANLNRGLDANKPSGFKDGFAAEARYYFERGRFSGWATAGYFFSKQLVEPDGDPYKPGVYAGAVINYNILNVPGKLYAFADLMSVSTNSHIEGGAAWRPFSVTPETELRLTLGKYFNVMEKPVAQSTTLLEVKYYFDTRRSQSSPKNTAQTP